MIKDAIAKDTCFVQRHGPTALCLRDLTKKMASEKLGEAPLGLLKQTSFVVRYLDSRVLRMQSSFP
jgi:hypothetical protein